MRKRYVALSALVMMSFQIRGQFPVFQWQLGWGNAEYDIQPSITTGTDDKIFVTGQFTGMVDFDPGPGVTAHDASFFTHAYLSCFDADGNFLWVKTFGNEICQAKSIAFDPAGYVYLKGQYLGTTDFNPGQATFNLTPANNSYDAFLSKFDTDGNFIWAVSIGGAGHEFGGVLTVDASGDVIVSGVFTGISDFDPGTEELIFDASGNFRSDNYIVKYGSDGSFKWAKHLKGDGQASSTGIDADRSGNIYLSGYFDDHRDFDPGLSEQLLTFRGPWEGFIASYNSEGDYRWALRVGGDGDDWVNGIHVQDDGTIYATGYFSATVDFDPGPDSVKYTAINTDAFIVKMDHTGQLIWATQTGDISYDQGRAVTVDQEGNVYMTGWYAETVDFDPGPGEYLLTSLGANDLDDAFIQKLDADGHFLWAYTLGSLDNDEGHRVHIDSKGHLLLSGVYRGTAGFYPGDDGQDSLQFAGSADAYLVKWKQCSAALFNTDVIYFENTLISQHPSGTYQWVDCDNGFNPVENATSQFYMPLSSGNYAVILTEDDCSVMTQCVSVIVTSAADLQSPLSAHVYPNPTSGIATIDLGAEVRAVDVSLIDLSGRVRLSQEYAGVRFIPLDIELPAGIYCILLSTENAAEMLKLVVERM